MRQLLVLALLLAAAPAAAQTDADSIRESMRVARLVGAEIYSEGGDLRPLIQRRKAIQTELQHLVHVPSPDMAEVTRLRAEQHELSMRIMDVSYQATERALSNLSPEERLSYVRSEYPQPPQVIIRP